MPRNFVLILDGPMGAGKTTVAKILHKKLKHTALIRRDALKWLLSDFRRTRTDNKIAQDATAALFKIYLKHPINIILEQSFVKKQILTTYIRLARLRKREIFLYHLDAPRATLLRRLAQRPKPVAAKTRVSKTRVLRNLRAHKKHMAATVLDSSRLTSSQVANRILSNIPKTFHS